MTARARALLLRGVVASAAAFAAALLVGCGGGGTAVSVPARCPAGARAPTAPFTCFPAAPVVAPALLAPGRVRLVFRGDPTSFDKGGSYPKPADGFVVVDVTESGEDFVALGRCPVPDAAIVALATASDGSLHALCAETKLGEGAGGYYARALPGEKDFHVWLPRVTWIAPDADKLWQVETARVFPEGREGPAALLSFGWRLDHQKRMGGSPAQFYPTHPGQTLTAPPGVPTALPLVWPPDLYVSSEGYETYVERLGRHFVVNLSTAGTVASKAVTCGPETCVLVERVHPAGALGDDEDVLHVHRFEL